jgi:hypothetical protein
MQKPKDQAKSYMSTLLVSCRHAMVAASCAQQASPPKSSSEAYRPFTPSSAVAAAAAALGGGGRGQLVVAEDQISSRGGWLGRSLADEEVMQVRRGLLPEHFTCLQLVYSWQCIYRTEPCSIWTAAETVMALSKAFCF